MIAYSNDSLLNPTRIIRLPEVRVMTGLSRSGIYARINQNSPGFDPAFPQPVNLGVRSVGWVASEVEDWINAQIANSRRAPRG